MLIWTMFICFVMCSYFAVDAIPGRKTWPTPDEDFRAEAPTMRWVRGRRHG